MYRQQQGGRNRKPACSLTDDLTLWFPPSRHILFWFSCV